MYCKNNITIAWQMFKSVEHLFIYKWGPSFNYGYIFPNITQTKWEYDIDIFKYNIWTSEISNVTIEQSWDDVKISCLSLYTPVNPMLEKIHNTYWYNITNEYDERSSLLQWVYYANDKLIADVCNDIYIYTCGRCNITSKDVKYRSEDDMHTCYECFSKYKYCNFIEVYHSKDKIISDWLIVSNKNGWYNLCTKLNSYPVTLVKMDWWLISIVFKTNEPAISIVKDIHNIYWYDVKNTFSKWGITREFVVTNEWEYYYINNN